MSGTARQSGTGPEYDVAIIGGGFFGCALALLFRSVTKRMVLLERGTALMERASAVNQARVHSGLHYPRNFTTARRSQRDFPLFVDAFRDCIVDDFRMLYAIARQKSRVSANRFEAMFRNMGAPIARARPADRALFDTRAVEEVFECMECAFDWKRLRTHMTVRMEAQEIPVRLSTEAVRVGRRAAGGLDVTLAGGEVLTASAVFNVSYAGLNGLLATSGEALLPLKHELAEIALVEPPPDLEGRAVTVMDGPFFSIMPFPAEGIYSLTHVLYTPHEAWTDAPGRPSAYRTAEALPHRTRWRHMVQDATRYLPAMAETVYRRSLFDVKTVLVRNEDDDGRPILLQEQAGMPGLYSVLGGKVDNIFDLFECLTRTRPEWAGLSTELVLDR